MNIQCLVAAIAGIGMKTQELAGVGVKPIASMPAALVLAMLKVGSFAQA